MLVRERERVSNDLKSLLFAEAKSSTVVRVHISVNADEMLI